MVNRNPNHHTFLKQLQEVSFITSSLVGYTSWLVNIIFLNIPYVCRNFQRDQQGEERTEEPALKYAPISKEVDETLAAIN